MFFPRASLETCSLCFKGVFVCVLQYRYQNYEPGSHLMCKKWYQLITCAEPVRALNRRSFLCTFSEPTTRSFYKESFSLYTRAIM